MSSEKESFNETPPFNDNFGKGWGDDSLLDIEKDLDGLEEMGELGETGESGEDILSDMDVELDEWEEYMDSQWVKILDE
jgi:hypothetical protein